MKNKILSIFMMLIMCFSVFAGCSLVTRNDKAYYDAVVGQITYTTGETETISKQNLISAYNSYGYNYVDNYNMTRQEAFLTTLDTIIDNRLTIKAVENYYEEHLEEGEMLNGNETTYIWDQTYDALYSNLHDYLNEVLGIESNDDSATESDSDSSVYTPYEQQAYLDEHLVIHKRQSATTIRETYKGRQVDGVYVDYDYVDETTGEQPFKAALYDKIASLFEGNDEDARNWRDAFGRYISDIKANYGYENLSSNREWFDYEMDRVYSILKDNYLIEKYSVIYNRTLHQDADISNVTVKDILSLYSSKVRADYATYQVANNTSDFASSILSDVGNMDYIMTGSEVANYFYVGYIKVDMTAEQQAQLSNLETARANNYIDYDEYEKSVNGIYKQIKTSTDNLSPESLLSRVKEDVEKYRYLTVDNLTEEQKEEAQAEGVTLETYVANANKAIAYQRAYAFRPYMYKYSDDDTLKNADYNAVFGVTNDGQVLAQDSFMADSAVPEDLANAILNLYNNGDAQVGDMTEFVRTDDGVYMFFYAGAIENLFSGIDKDFDVSKNSEAIQILTSTRTNIFSNKTLFDALYEECVSDRFYIFQNMNINNLRTNMTTRIVAIENNIEDLY